MILRILIKLLTLIIGVLALNVLCYWMFKLEINTGPGKIDMWINSIAYYLSNNLFISINQFIPLSWIISTLGCLAFIIFDYLKYKESNRLFTQSISEESKDDILAIMGGLLISAGFLFLLGFGLSILECFFFVFFEFPYKIGLGAFINSHDYLLSSYLNPLWTIDILEDFSLFVLINRCIAMPVTILCLVLPFERVFFRISYNFMIFSYGLFLLPVTIIWIYPIVLIWLSIIPYPTHGIDSVLVVIYSIILGLIILLLINWLRLFISEYKAKKRGLLREEIKAEILNEIQGSNAEQN